MSTSNIASSKTTDLQVLSSILINEYNAAGVNVDSSWAQKGVFLSPSEIVGRPDDITGYIVTAANEYGKLDFSDPDGLLSLTQLSDVTITTPALNEVLLYDGTEWVNGAVPANGAAGANTEVQYNNNGVLGASDTFLFNDATSTATVTNLVTTGQTDLATAGTLGFFGETAINQEAAIADADAQGVGYVQADVQSIADAVNGILASLRLYGLIAT
jgi:hypothetical protein